MAFSDWHRMPWSSPLLCLVPLEQGDCFSQTFGYANIFLRTVCLRVSLYRVYRGKFKWGLSLDLIFLTVQILHLIFYVTIKNSTHAKIYLSVCIFGFIMPWAILMFGIYEAYLSSSLPYPNRKPMKSWHNFAWNDVLKRLGRNYNRFHNVSYQQLSRKTCRKNAWLCPYIGLY